MTKKRDKKNNPTSSPAPAGTAPATNPAAPPSGRLTWRQTGWLLAGGWGALAIFALLWRIWTGRPLIIYFAACVIGICYTLVVLFDRFRED